MKDLNTDKLNLENYLDQFEETVQKNEFKVYVEEKIKKIVLILNLIYLIKVTMT
ncbi:hypothetical protein ACQ9ZF_11460 (plasmid) [Cetobacterium somerae]|uniref:hypothetical protein n=1 Tax=Cetobacterium somerae TaxID=188913 RepID=UPI003D76710E